MIRLVLPHPLRLLARIEEPEVLLDLPVPVTMAAVLDAVEARYPGLRGTLRDPTTRALRPFLRIFACEQDITHERFDAALPRPIALGTEPLILLAAIAGGLTGPA